MFMFVAVGCVLHKNYQSNAILEATLRRRDFIQIDTY
jgi:hypothetical protein